MGEPIPLPFSALVKHYIKPPNPSPLPHAFTEAKTLKTLEAKYLPLEPIPTNPLSKGFYLPVLLPALIHYIGEHEIKETSVCF